MKTLYVKTGDNLAVKLLVLAEVKKVGYDISKVSQGNFVARAAAFRFEKKDSGFVEDDSYYDDLSGDHFDVRIELGVFLDFLMYDRLTIITAGVEHEVMCNTDGSITVGCTTVPSDLFEKIVVQRNKVLSLK